MITFKDLFIDPEAALSVMRPKYCAELKKEVAQAGDSTPDEESEVTGEGPVDCPALSDLPSPVPVNDRQGPIDGFVILVGHFRQWADGPFQAAVGVTPQLIALIKPGYRADFAVGRRAPNLRK